MLSPTSFSQCQKLRQPLEIKALMLFTKSRKRKNKILVKLKLGKQNSRKFPPFWGKNKRKENTSDHHPGKIMENKCCMVLKMAPIN
jgi:hypothetical protein